MPQVELLIVLRTCIQVEDGKAFVNAVAIANDCWLAITQNIHLVGRQPSDLLREDVDGVAGVGVLW